MMMRMLVVALAIAAGRAKPKKRPAPPPPDDASLKHDGPLYDAGAVGAVAGGKYPLPPPVLNGSAVDAARELAARNRAALAAILARLAGGDEARLCAGPFPEKRATELQWLHVPKCGSTFATTFVKYGCDALAKRPDVYLGAPPPPDLAKPDGRTMGTTALARMAGALCGDDHRFGLLHNDGVVASLTHFAAHYPIQNPKHDPRVAVMKNREGTIGSRHFIRWRSFISAAMAGPRDYAAMPGLQGCFTKMLHGCYCATRPKEVPPESRRTYAGDASQVACPWQWKTLDVARAAPLALALRGLQEAYNASVPLPQAPRRRQPRGADAAPPAPAVSRNVEDWLGGKPPPAAPAPPPRVVQLPKPAAAAATPYMPAKDASPLRVCYEHEGEPGGETCVEPELQYTTKTNVRWIPAIADEEADFVLYLPVCTPTPPPVANGPNKLVVLDEGDGAGFYPRVGEHDYLLYLKRSFVTKSDGVYTGTGRRYNRHYYPMAYSVADSYFHAELMGKVARTIDVLCSNRPTSKQPTRSRVVSWIHTYLEAHPDVRGIAGDVNSGGRREINDGYFGAMRKSKIVVTCNPSHWEGDFRTFEALASGALIFVDEMYVPHPRPFVDGEHVVVYDNSDEKAFAEKLAYYLARPDEAAKIAAAGLKHALKYHRAVSRMDWVLRSAHEIKSYADADSHPYTHTARAIKHDVKATTQIADLVKQNKVHRKQLGFRRMLRRRRRRR
ncbi:glycosyl transferase [Aureococcus anophagefferens]|nr:glycosyl transferase [Aureococcus anophagefferens]